MSLAEGSEELETVSFYIHQALELAFNGNIGAPIHEKLQTGAKVAAEYPDSKFYAVDLTTRNSIDHNITFISCDIHHKLPFPDNEFDYVFSRNKTEFFSKNTFQGFLFEIFRVLKPEGWLEIVHSLYADDDYGGAFSKGANISFNRERGIDFDLITHLEDYLKMTGKTEFLSSQIAKIPLGGAGFGEFTSEIVLNYVKNMRNAGSPFEGYEQPLEDLESEMKEKRGEIYSKQKRVFARKKNMDTLKDA
ncbi:18581_t:CDS:2 [Dentiscutata erythropus]|uniref:18581_t:CDS:1 n=1 Tax=Dentiscutata erythropus TaxID=1348616 RepID=A0A9N9HSN5_9GLOM|nr:18581_t:CDS:2 [Dentiscutata erythropus]